MTLDPNAQIVVTGRNGISLGNNATIAINSGAQVSATVNTAIAGLNGVGGNTIDFGSNNTVTIQQGATVSANGTASNAEAINTVGSGNVITNSGTIRSANSSAIYFDNLSGLNTIDNEATGVITTTSASGNVIGSSGSAAVHFINKGAVKGNLGFAGGNDILDLYTGSTITGTFNGGGGTNVINLWGTGSQGLPGAIQNFQTLNKQDTGTWTLSGSIAGGMKVNVNQGTLVLDGSNAGFTGSVTVAAAGTLEGDSDSLPPSVTDNGQVRFAQTADGTYAGAIQGTGAVTKTNGGTLTLTGANTYSGGTSFNQGAVKVSTDGALGAATGSLTFNGGTLQFGNSFNLAASRALTLNAGGGTLDTQAFNTTVSQAIAGSGSLTKAGSGTLTLLGSNVYSGGTTISAGTLQLGNGGTTGSIVGNVNNNGALVFNRSDALTLDGLLSGTGTVTQSGSGTTILSGANSYQGATNVNAGALYVNGDQSAATGATAVASGATLGGNGTIGGNVTVAAGATLSPGALGAIPGTLTIGGNLNLAGNSNLSYSLGQAGVAGGAYNDLVNVQGNLVLDGTLNVVTSPGGSFDTGIYRVFNYNGTLTNNGLSIGTIPSQNFYLQTSVNNQINLINTNGLTLRYWDGAAGPKNDQVVNGGNGTWQNASGNDNWTDLAGAVNAPFTDRAFAIFEAAPGTVTVDNSLGQVNVGAMQFASNGYVVQGENLTLAGTVADPGHTEIRVGDGASDGAADFATINAVLVGNSTLVKTDLGTLVLNGANTYIGGTQFDGGTIQISADHNLGDAAGALTFDGGGLRTTSSLALSRAITLDAGGGTLAPDADTTLTVSSVIGGTGSLTQNGAGSTVLTSDSTYAGGTRINTGTLQLGNGGTTGSIAGNVANNGTLVFDRSDVSSFTGAISGTGGVRQAGTGTTVLTAANTYSGITQVDTGALAIGDAAHADAALAGGAVQVANGATLGGYGSITGNVTNDGTIAVANALPTFASNGTGNFRISGNLTNAGLVQLGGSSIGNALTVAGNYAGQNATIALNTFLAGDGAPSDRLVVSGGTASGSSTLKVTNVGGPGAQTTGDGITVVQATNGATTGADTFTLAGGTVSAGAYAYYLAKGGTSGGTGESWYLRNTVPSKPTTGTEPPVVAADGTPKPLAEAVADAGSSGESPVPVYRPEVPLYAEAPAVARQLGLLQIDTFHDRQGDQGLLTETGSVPASWARAWGGHSNISQGGDVKPAFDGTVWGTQVGQDMYANSDARGNRNHYGFLLGFSHAVGDVSGLALGQPGLGVGSLQVSTYDAGGYWTHIGSGGWYTDAVAMGSVLSVRTHSSGGSNASTNGGAFTGSVEAGLPIALGYGLTLEPQAQLVWQWLSLDRFNDGISDVTWNNGNTFLARIGARLQRAFDVGGVAWKPYLRLNVLRSFGANDATTFGATTTLDTHVGQTDGQIGAGVTAQLTKRGSVYAAVSYLTNLGGEHQRTITGNAGVRWAW
ncbi:autotransporter outer membrane beta-barrel domain-containing protein [Paraburkholderia flava]|uniref:autotransporter outer membrane beta-barrel domain-containing protein n=1 Tax=Paraburkholderia flava TaxID=2547393 RepID=UPI00141513B2|nr:autotransporter outer membrane beta-barrel domain-containing protein [Paraburkholderia flava]